MKKFLVAAVIALMVIVPVTNAAFADEGDGGPDGDGGGRRNRRGHVVQISSLSLSEITFEGKEGEEVSLAITGDTQFLAVGEDGPVDASFSDFAVGDYVALKLGRSEVEGEGPVLLAIVALPEDFDPESRPEKFDGSKVGGEVTAISSTSITVTNKDGEESTFAIDADTQQKSDDAIEVGDKVGIVYDEDTNTALAILEGCAGGHGKRGPGGKNGPGGNGGPGGQDGAAGPQS